MSDARQELSRMWKQHMSRPFPDEWGILEERHGLPTVLVELEGSDAAALRG
jgi:hypothetical protein